MSPAADHRHAQAGAGEPRRLAGDLPGRGRRSRSRLGAGDRGGRAHGGCHRRQGRARLWHQHRLRQARERAHRGGRSRAPAAQHRALACRGRRRAHIAARRAADARPQAREPRPGRLGRAAGNGGDAAGDAGEGAHPRRAAPGLGRRLGRSRPARAYGRGHARHRRDVYARGPQDRRGGAGVGRAGAGRAGPQGGPRPPQRHAVLDRACAGRSVRGRQPVPHRARHRRALHRGRQGLRRPLRSTRACAEPPSQPGRLRRGPARADGRQRHPRVAPPRRRPRAGPLLPALPAAGDGRHPRHAAACRERAGGRGQRRVRQSADHRRRGHGAVGRQLPCPGRGDRRRHHGARHLRDGRHRRAARCHAGRPGAVAAAGVPHPQTRPQLRLHDPAGDGRRTGVGEQAARGPGLASTRSRPPPTRRTTCRWPRTPRAACCRWPRTSRTSSASSC